MNMPQDFPALRDNEMNAADLWKPDKILVEKKAS
jgi:hypothetical protein